VTLKVPVLRDRCKALNLPHSGVKADLVARLSSEGRTPAKPIPQLDGALDSSMEEVMVDKEELLGEVEEVKVDKVPCPVCGAPDAPDHQCGAAFQDLQDAESAAASLPQPKKPPAADCCASCRRPVASCRCRWGPTLCGTATLPGYENLAGPY
jgi:hypothetical protein